MPVVSYGSSSFYHKSNWYFIIVISPPRYDPGCRWGVITNSNQSTWRVLSRLWLHASPLEQGFKVSRFLAGLYTMEERMGGGRNYLSIFSKTHWGLGLIIRMWKFTGDTRTHLFKWAGSVWKSHTKLRSWKNFAVVKILTMYYLMKVKAALKINTKIKDVAVTCINPLTHIYGRSHNSCSNAVCWTLFLVIRTCKWGTLNVYLGWDQERPCTHGT